MNRFVMIRNVLLSVVLTTLCQLSFSMTLVRSGDVLVMSGTVEQGDFARVQNLIEGVSQVVLKNNPGGDVTEGIHIGYLLRDNQIDTVIDGYCYSSCALIFLGGEHRALLKNAVIGFHGVKRYDLSFPGQTNAIVIDYVRTMDPKFDQDLAGEVFYNLQGNDLLLVTMTGSRIVEQGRVRQLHYTISGLGITS